jgi:hypothetical protein
VGDLLYKLLVSVAYRAEMQVLCEDTLRCMRIANEVLVKVDQDPAKQSKRRTKNRATEKAPPMPAIPLDVKSRRNADKESVAGSVLGSMGDGQPAGDNGPGFSTTAASQAVLEMEEDYSAIAEGGSYPLRNEQRGGLRATGHEGNGSGNTSDYLQPASRQAAQPLAKPQPSSSRSTNSRSPPLNGAGAQGGQGGDDGTPTGKGGSGEVALEVLQDVVAAAQSGQHQGENGPPQGDNGLPNDEGADLDNKAEALRVVVRHNGANSEANGAGDLFSRSMLVF